MFVWVFTHIYTQVKWIHTACIRTCSQYKKWPIDPSGGLIPCSLFSLLTAEIFSLVGWHLLIWLGMSDKWLWSSVPLTGLPQHTCQNSKSSILSRFPQWGVDWRDRESVWQLFTPVIRHRCPHWLAVSVTNPSCVYKLNHTLPNAFFICRHTAMLHWQTHR